MTIQVKHSKVSTIPDTDDTSLVRPSDWNADHTLVGLGTMAEQNANNVNITGGSITGVTGLGDVVGPASSTDNAVARFDSTTGKLLQNSVVTVGDTGAVAGVTTLAASTNVTTPIVQATNSAGLSLKNSTGTTQISMGAGGGDNVTIAVATNINGANAQIDISPTGTGHVHIKPTGSGAIEIAPTNAGTLNNMVIGGTTPLAGKFTTLEATGTSTLGTASSQYIQAEGGATAVLLSAQGAGANIPLALQPKGTGAIQAQATTSTTAGGNVRGANAVDWQTTRGNANQVASGTQSFLGGGTSNRCSAFAGAVVGGSTNAAASNYSFIGGGTNNAASSGDYGTIVGGQSNTAAGYYNFIGAGFTNSGTSSSAVTTQSGTMNATTAVTLSGSNANIRVGQYITGTSIAGDTYVAAISGTSLTLSKNASGSSTSTLSFFTPHGVVVGGGNNQATGSYSFIGGGGDGGTAGNRNVASGAWSTVTGGWNNRATGEASFVGGGGSFGGGASGNLSSGTSSFIGGGFGNGSSGYSSATVGGAANLTSNNYAFVGAGSNNTSNGGNSAIMGGAQGSTRGITGNHVFPACLTPIANTLGVSQSALLVLGVQTTDATATALRSDTSAAGTTNQVILPNNSAYFFTGEVVSGVTGGGNTKGWTIEGVIKRGANAASTTLVGTPTVTSLYADAGAATWALAVTADTTNGGIRVTFTGQAATTIRTVCQIRTTEMTY